MLKLFLEKEKYKPSIYRIRHYIRANGDRYNVQELVIETKESGSIRFFINCAFSANTAYSKVNGSLYTLGFGNINGVYLFNLDAELLSDIPSPIVIMNNMDGSYRSLGFVHGLPDIDHESLIDSVNILSGYNGNLAQVNSLRASLARLIIATNESIRFDIVTDAIYQVFRECNLNCVNACR
ncbi:ribosome-inactivating family protein [Endozoicomonas atrinae]|uniref:ribosome-inactivating family protein n=1 Tax=Endozoicomonas atrinae TaxID=1333660 RepID=UPI000824DEC5|nr:ribosome-inactivating family protein [Endozoicomonas atrinae]